MDPTVIAGLVAAQSPDHASHTPHELLREHEDGTVDVRCASPCTVGLTLRGPRAAAPAPAVEPGEVAASFTVEKDGKVTERPKKGGGHGS